ncbi:hypothetical protein VITU9109_17408 [Vibrio tubiashii ATCC 19109]|uniref:Uncharacterized protein n=1 Tax=Vibrio tubiashii ATCC 19109 TaxID=1051646 RepID=A0ABP2LP79_9VIBR|nr:hypothetical protein VITU9109_17408 [Vibrio tubiashii ATCC 19109]
MWVVSHFSGELQTVSMQCWSIFAETPRVIVLHKWICGVAQLWDQQAEVRCYCFTNL